MQSRRDWLATAARGLALAAVAAVPAPLMGALQSSPGLTVYKDEGCGCCRKWVDHMRANGFGVTAHDVPDIDVIKKQLGVPGSLASCHTALVGGYVVEGHVPIADIDRLLAERPARVRGIAVPGMPVGSPGMEAPDGRVEPYQVVAFDAAGNLAIYRG